MLRLMALPCISNPVLPTPFPLEWELIYMIAVSTGGFMSAIKRSISSSVYHKGTSSEHIM